MRSYNEIFKHIPVRKGKRNVFNLSHEVKLSCNMADLVPILCEEIVPDDTWRVNTEMMMRFAPMLAPIMHRVNVYTHFFFVPNRLIWDNWETFITGGEDGKQSPVYPYLNNYTIGPGSLRDYMGLPNYNNSKAPLKCSALPFRAYQLIYNEYYRDQNLTPEVLIYKGDGLTDENNSPGIVDLHKRAWEKDYFTSALPWTQRGGEVKLPFGTTAPIMYDADTQNVQGLRNSAGELIDIEGSFGLTANDPTTKLVNNGSGVSNANVDLQGTHYADLEDAIGITVNDLRRTTRLQAWLERNARGGARYIEQILSHFGVVGDDARLQRPQYLGGGKTPVVISEVLQTSSTDQNSPQANMAGHGIAVGNTHQFKHYFKEHGWLIGIMSILPRTGYQQGIPRKYLKFDKFDYYFPEFAHLGEQPIYNKELYVADDGANDNVFGYTPRYAEYKHGTSRVHGDFRSNLSFWHLNRIFNNRPNLNTSFVEADPSDRIFALDDDGATQKVWVQLYNDIKAKRQMPKFGVPML